MQDEMESSAWVQLSEKTRRGHSAVLGQRFLRSESSRVTACRLGWYIGLLGSLEAIGQGTRIRKDSILWCEVFKSWCEHNGIRPRYRANGNHGCIAITERLIGTMKD